MAQEKKSLNVRIPVSLYDDLKKFVENSDAIDCLSQSKVVSLALRDYIEKFGKGGNDEKI